MDERSGTGTKTRPSARAGAARPRAKVAGTTQPSRRAIFTAMSSRFRVGSDLAVSILEKSWQATRAPIARLKPAGPALIYGPMTQPMTQHPALPPLSIQDLAPIAKGHSTQEALARTL